MKKLFLMLMTASFIFLTATIATAGEVKVAPYTGDAIGKIGILSESNSDHNLTTVRDQGDNVIITITKVRLTPIGKDTDGDDLVTPETVELYSGIMDAAGVKAPFAIAKVVNGTATFTIPNSAKVAKCPVIEHLWGRGNGGKMALVHDPLDPWVISDKGDLNTLAIGLVMYPDSQTIPLGSLDEGKLTQGKHPELAPPAKK